MTEAEWLACENPALLLLAVRRKASGRKLCLLGCACQTYWSLHLPAGEPIWGAVETLGRYADGLAGAQALEAARRRVHEALARDRDLRAERRIAGMSGVRMLYEGLRNSYGRLPPLPPPAALRADLLERRDRGGVTGMMHPQRMFVE